MRLGRYIKAVVTLGGDMEAVDTLGMRYRGCGYTWDAIKRP